MIDAPGIKEIGLAHFEAGEIGHYSRRSGSGCTIAGLPTATYVNEPHCAVRKAVEAGEIHPSRYRSYLGMMQGDE